MRVQLDLYEESKYWDGSRSRKTVEYDVSRYEETWFSDAEAEEMGITEIDESGGYTILYLENDEKIIFRSSHIDLYVVG